MTTISLAEAKAGLSELLNKVERGQEVVITRRGHPIVRLLPV
ncbi:MAG: Antitoxin Phd YefM, type toxin-antitoxin system [Pseudomonadota bacterium]